MSEKFFIEGHKPKKSLVDEETLIIDRGDGYTTIDAATKSARKFFDKQKELGLIVIYKEDPAGMKEGIKLIFRDNEEGKLEEFIFSF